MSTPISSASAASRASSRGYAVRSDASLNWVGLTNSQTTTTSHSARARRMSERWPSWNAPIVGTSPIERPSRRCANTTGRSSATVRIVFMRSPPWHVRPAVRVAATKRVEQIEQVRGCRGDRVTLGRNRRLVAPRHRAGQRPLRADPRPVLDRRPDEWDEQFALDADAGGETLGGRLERDRGSSTRSRPPRGRSARSASAISTGRIPSAPASPCANASARGVEPAIAAPAPSKRAPSGVTVISGCIENASCPASGLERCRPGAVADKRPRAGSPLPRARSGCPGRTAGPASPGQGRGEAPRPRGPSTAMPAAPAAAASAVPSRPRPTIVRRAQGGSEEISRSSSRIGRYRSA